MQTVQSGQERGPVQGQQDRQAASRELLVLLCDDSVQESKRGRVHEVCVRVQEQGVGGESVQTEDYVHQNMCAGQPREEQLRRRPVSIRRVW